MSRVRLQVTSLDQGCMPDAQTQTNTKNRERNNPKQSMPKATNNPLNKALFHAEINEPKAENEPE